MSKRSRQTYEMDQLSEMSTIIDGILDLLSKKNIVCTKQIDIQNKKISIELIDNNSNKIGELDGGIGEFKIIENGNQFETDAFSISWVKIEDNYKGQNLGSFLVIYCIYLCNNNFPDIKYIVLDDDTDETNQDKNIYRKLGFIYQETKEIQLENGEMSTVNSGPEMQLNINAFLNSDWLYKLTKIQNTIRNFGQFKGGKRIKKTRKYKKSKKSKKSNKSKKTKKYRK